MARGRMLTLDLSTHIGWTSGPIVTDLPKFGHFDLPSTGPDLGRFASAYDEWLRMMLDKERPDVVIFEQPVLHKQTQMIVLRKLYGLAWHTEFVCRGRAATREANNSSVKAWWTGSGRCQKEDMIAVAQANGFEVQTHDEADAIAVRFYAISQMYPDRMPPAIVTGLVP